MNRNLQQELIKAAYVKDALTYIQSIPDSPLYKYQEISGMMGYDADRYMHFEMFLSDLFKAGIDAKGFCMDAVKLLLNADLKDPVTYFLIAQKNKDVLNILPKSIASDVRRYFNTRSKDELTKVSFKQDSQKYFDYCIQVVSDSQLLMEKKTLGINEINSSVLSYCGINESTVTELGLMHISKVYGKKAISMSNEWERYQRAYRMKRNGMEPQMIKAIATGENLINNIKKLH